MTIAMASSLGPALRQIRLPRSPLSARPPSSSASSPLIRSSAALRGGGVSVGLTGDIRAEPVGDLGGLAGDLGGVDAPRALVGDREILDHPAGPAAQQDHPVAE